MSVKHSFKLNSSYKPSGQQPEAIKRIIARIENGDTEQVLLGVTGSGKTFTLANVIEKLNRPALLLAPNKTLAAQLYTEMREFFPENAVEYFVSYYDYYQPEAFVPATNTYIEKDASINKHIEQMRLKATRSVMERSDTIIIATVSAIYGLGDPEIYQSMTFEFNTKDNLSQRSLLQQLVNMQYKRNEITFEQGQYRVRGDIVDIFPSDGEKHAIRIEFLEEEIENIKLFDPLTGEIIEKLSTYNLYPKTHYVSSQARIDSIMHNIRDDLKQEFDKLLAQGKILEGHRLKTRVELDLEMMEEIGYCQGIENYSRYLSGRPPGDTPSTLIDYLPKDAIIILDESHVMLPQIRGMHAGDQSRKKNLVEHGFRLSSALDNRPLKFEEFITKPHQKLYVSATPGAHEKLCDTNPTELVVRPTGLLDPIIEIRPQHNQVNDILEEIYLRKAKNERVLITTLTQKMAENLSEYLLDKNIKVKHLHAKTETVERSEILRDLRLGTLDVVVGINLLREGLDLPEVSLVAIFDADKEGFLRSGSSLIQTVGRAARNLSGKAIMYADSITQSMQYTITETQRRRMIQEEYNNRNNIKPQSIIKKIHDTFEIRKESSKAAQQKSHSIENEITTLEQKMQKAAQELDFENAKIYRDQLLELKKMWLET